MQRNIKLYSEIINGINDSEPIFILHLHLADGRKRITHIPLDSLTELNDKKLASELRRMINHLLQDYR